MTAHAGALLSSVGCFGKLPQHGDFVRRGLPGGFAPGWHAWLEEGLAAAREVLGPAALQDAWAELGVWRFHLPDLPFGSWSTTGVLAPGLDAVGRAFPFTLLAVAPAGRLAPAPGDWFTELEALAADGLAGAIDIDALASRLPSHRAEGADKGRAGWWRGDAAPMAPPGMPLAELLRHGKVKPGWP